MGAVGAVLDVGAVCALGAADDAADDAAAATHRKQEVLETSFAKAGLDSSDGALHLLPFYFFPGVFTAFCLACAEKRGPPWPDRPYPHWLVG